MASPDPAPDFKLSSANPEEQRSWKPFVFAGVVVALILVILILIGGRHRAESADAAAAPDPYAAHVAIANLKMSEASNFAGGKVTYLDGQITNQGDRTLTGVTVQVIFKNALGEVGQRETLPLNLIRMREPYIDTQPVSAAPIRQGEQRDFRLIFDHVIEDWNQQYPEVRVLRVSTQ